MSFFVVIRVVGCVLSEVGKVVWGPGWRWVLLEELGGVEGAVRESVMLSTMGRVRHRMATSRVCAFVGRECPSVKEKAMCEGLNVLMRRNGIEGIRIPSNSSHFSFALRGRCRIRYMGYKRVFSISVSIVSRVRGGVGSARKVGCVDRSVFFGNVYRRYRGGRVGST